MDIVVLLNVQPEDSENLISVLDRALGETQVAIQRLKKSERNKKDYQNRKNKNAENAETMLNFAEFQEERENEKEEEKEKRSKKEKEEERVKEKEELINIYAPEPQKTETKADGDNFWNFAKEYADMAKAFHEETGLKPIKTQFGRWINDLRDLSEAGISVEQMRKTVAYMQSENIPMSSPGSLLKTAQWLKARGSVPVRGGRSGSQPSQIPKEKTFHDLAVERGLVEQTPANDFIDSFWRN